MERTRLRTAFCIPGVVVAMAALFAANCTPIQAVGPPASKPGHAASSVASVKAPGAVPEESGFFDRKSRKQPDDASDLCAVADSNLDRAIFAVMAKPVEPRAKAPIAPWDRKSKPLYLDLVADRFALTKAERARLFENGFVVPARLEHASYARAFHDVFQSQLPVYISMDALLHAVFKDNDALIAELERTTLAPLLGRTLEKLHGGLAAAAADYPKDIANDLDVYLSVARSLAGEKSVPSALGNDAEADRFVQKAKAAGSLESARIFGRERMIDFTQYTPRGHYTHSSPAYFRSAMWLSRLEFNLVSRSSRSSAPGIAPDPRETPREALVALALADLAGKTGAMPDVAELHRWWTALSGAREDVGLADLAGLRAGAGIAKIGAPDTFERFKAALGDRFQRTARIHYMPQGSTVLPAIATFLGPRVAPDIAALRPLAHADTSGRYGVRAADVAYLLGHDRARAYLADDLATFPTFSKNLDAARAIAARPDTSGSLYALWMRSVRALAGQPEGVTPSYMSTDAFRDLRLNSAIAGFGQIRHNYVLMTGQGYEEGGCEIPDGYVEPAPEVLDALIAYYDRVASLLGSKGKSARHLRFGDVLRALRAIVADELGGLELTVEQRRLLAGVAEIVPGSSSSLPMYTGWYFRMFRSSRHALEDASFLSDFHTSSNSGEVAYVGASEPRLGIFVVDTGGPPRLMVGPVARAFEFRAPLTKRLDDESARAVKGSAPWEQRYTVPAPRVEPPPLAIQVEAGTPPVVLVKSTRALGPITIELLDHHGQPCWKATTSVGTRTVRVRPKPPGTLPGRTPCGDHERSRVRVGEATFDIDKYTSTLGGMTTPEWTEERPGSQLRSRD